MHAKFCGERKSIRRFSVREVYYADKMTVVGISNMEYIVKLCYYLLLLGRGLYGEICESSQPSCVSPLGNHSSHYWIILHGLVLCVSLHISRLLYFLQQD